MDSQAELFALVYIRQFFFLYDITNDPYTGEARVSGGTKMVIQNSALQDHKIEKPLQNLDLTRYKKSPRKLDRRTDA